VNSIFVFSVELCFAKHTFTHNLFMNALKVTLLVSDCEEVLFAFGAWDGFLVGVLLMKIYDFLFSKM
jgi:hypothetical protein